MTFSRNSFPPEAADPGAALKWQLSPLKRFLDDDAVTEICVNRPGEVFAERNGVWTAASVPELTYPALEQLGTAAARFAERSFSETVPVLSAVLPGGERAQFVRPPACTPGTVSVTIRKAAKRILTLDGFREAGFFDRVCPAGGMTEDDRILLEIRDRALSKSLPLPEQAAARVLFLEEAVKRGKNIVFAGETGSGKTTFMKSLIQLIPEGERIITIEDVPELVLPNHANHVRLFYPGEAREGDTVSAASLLRSCLRMKPDRILLAELRGPETFDFLSACLSGHAGSVTSCHAGSCEGAFHYLALRVLQSPSAAGMSFADAERMLRMTVDVVVHIHKSPVYGRHISGIYFDPASKTEALRHG